MALWNKATANFDTLVGNKQAAEAVLAIMYGAARSGDGNLGQKEKDKIDFAMLRHQLLKDTPKDQHNAFIQNKLAGQFDWDVADGLAACLKEVRDIRGKPHDMKVQIVRAGVVAAAADGDLDAHERKFLLQCCDVAGVSPEEVGL